MTHQRRDQEAIPTLEMHQLIVFNNHRNLAFENEFELMKPVQMPRNINPTSRRIFEHKLKEFADQLRLHFELARVHVDDYSSALNTKPEDGAITEATKTPEGRPSRLLRKRGGLDGRGCSGEDRAMAGLQINHN